MLKELLPMIDMYIENKKLKDMNFRYSCNVIPNDNENKNSMENKAKSVVNTLLIVIILILNILYIINRKASSYVNFMLSIIAAIYSLFSEIIAT